MKAIGGVVIHPWLHRCLPLILLFFLSFCFSIDLWTLLSPSQRLATSRRTCAAQTATDVRDSAGRDDLLFVLDYWTVEELLLNPGLLNLYVWICWKKWDVIPGRSPPDTDHVTTRKFGWKGLVWHWYKRWFNMSKHTSILHPLLVDSIGLVLSVAVQRCIMVDDNVISMLFERQESNVDPIWIFKPFTVSIYGQFQTLVQCLTNWMLLY